MSTNYIEPVDITLWLARLAKVAQGELGSLERSLRHAFHLVQLAPIRLRRMVRTDISEDRFEALLDAGSLDAAASCLVGLPLVLSIEAGRRAGELRADIRCADCSTIFSGTASCAAAAILTAWCECLSSAPDPCVERTCLATDQDQHKGRSERHLLSTLH